MINQEGLREIWISKGYTQDKVAKKIGLQVRTFRNRIKNGTLTTNDIDKLVELLDIKNPTSIFFIQCVTLKETNKKERWEKWMKIMILK